MQADWRLELGRIWAWQTDLVTGRVHLDRAADEVFGIPIGPPGIDSAALRQLIHPEDLDAFTRAADAAVAGHDAVEAVIRVRKPGDAWLCWLIRQRAERDERGRVVGLASVAIDITAQRAERERIAGVADMVRLTAEALGVGFYERELGLASRAIWDDNMFRLYRRDPAAGQPGIQEWLQTHVHPDDRAALAARIKEYEEREEEATELSFRARWPDGDVRWIRAWTRRGRRDGREVRWGMHIDITDLVRADESRREARQAEQAQRQRLAQVEAASRQLRVLAEAMRRGAQALLDDAPTAPRTQAAELIEAAARMQGLLDALQAPPVTEAETTPARRLEVLCVEDNAVNLMLVREVLAMRPHVLLRTAEDGLSGVAAALAHPPHLLLLDVQLPDISGIEVMRRLRQHPALRGAHFVALSADAMQDHIQAALDAGFDDYWTKPIQFDRFLAHIDRLVAAMVGGSQGASRSLTQTSPSSR